MLTLVCLNSIAYTNVPTLLTELIDADKTMDLAIACDVLCYIGDLENAMPSVAAVWQRCCSGTAYLHSL